MVSATRISREQDCNPLLTNYQTAEAQREENW
jgi:hypothetical protein